MRYDDIIEISLKMLDNDDINFSNVCLLYELSKKSHHDLDLELFGKMGATGNFTHSEIINLNLNGINFKFIEKNKKLFVE